MYDELVKRLRESKNEQCYMGCFGICGDCKIDAELKQAADAIEELLSERDEVNADSWKKAFEVERDEHRWIPVTERLPEPNKKALLFIEGNCHLGYVLNDGRFRVLSLPYPTRPTHWMPLPEPPKEG